MSNAITAQDLTSAVLHYVETGKYPESEELIAANIGDATVPGLLHELDAAKTTLEVLPMLFLLSRSRMLTGCSARCETH